MPRACASGCSESICKVFWCRPGWLPPCLRPHTESSLGVTDASFGKCPAPIFPTYASRFRQSLSPHAPQFRLLNLKKCLAHRRFCRSGWQVTFCIPKAISPHGISKKVQGWSDNRFQLPFWYLEAVWLRTNYSFSLNLFAHLKHGITKPSYTLVRIKEDNSHYMLNTFFMVCFQ